MDEYEGLRVSNADLDIFKKIIKDAIDGGYFPKAPIDNDSEANEELRLRMNAELEE